MKNEKKIKIDELPKDHPFDVPENYFEDFPDKMQQRLRAKSLPESGKRTTWFYLKPQLAMAASLLLFALISLFAVRYLLNDNRVFIQNEDQYSEMLETEMDEHTLMKAYSEIMPVQQEYTSEAARDSIEYTNAMIDYLLSEDIDIDLIAEAI